MPKNGICVFAPMKIEEAVAGRVLAGAGDGVRVVRCGIGKVNMCVSLARELAAGFDVAVLFGLCGAKHGFRVGQRVIPAWFRQLDADSTGFADEAWDETVHLDPSVHALLGGDACGIGCSDKFVTDSALLASVELVDMESYAFVKMCRAFGKPCVVVKYVSDVVGAPDGGVSHFRDYVANRFADDARSFAGLLPQIRTLHRGDGT
jgi:nucleoside phosphorylase